MVTQPPKRLPRPRKIFSPSESLNRPSHFLLHFDSTDSYNIALHSSINNISGNKATLNIRGKKTVATIITSGTLESCENEQRKVTRASQQTFDVDAPNYDENEDINTVSASQKEDFIRTLSSSNPQVTNEKNHDCYRSDDENADSIADIDDNDEEADVTFDHSVHSNGALGTKRQLEINKKKRKQTFTNSRKPKRQRTSVIHTEQNQQIGGTNSTISTDINSKDVLNQIENQIVIYQNMITKTLKRMERKFDHHLGTNCIQSSKVLDHYRNEKGEVFPSEYKYQKKNLLNTPAKDILDFARKTLRILFSPDELKTHILPPERDHLRRPALDSERFSILLEVIRIKFRLDSDLMQQCFNDLLRTKLSNFLYEERRRESRRKIREHEKNMLSKNMLESAQYDHQESFADQCEETD